MRVGPRHAAVRIALVLVLASIAVPASAQLDRPGRPYRALFGGAQEEDSRQALDLSISLIGAYDDNVLAEEGQRFRRLDPGVTRSGYLTALQGRLGYMRRWAPLTTYASVDGSLRHYPDVGGTTSMYNSSVGFDLAHGLWKGANLGLGANAAYSSHDRVRLLIADPGATFLDQPDYSLFTDDVVRYAASVALSQNLRRWLNATAQYSYAGWEDANYQSLRGSISFNRKLTRHASARLGYSYRASLHNQDIAGRRHAGHAIDAGVDYGRALSLTRRTSVTFGSGLLILANPEVPEGGGELSLRQRLRLNGTATLLHEIGRSWRAQFQYARGLQLHEQFSEPVFSDSLSGRVGGYLGPRVDVSAVGAYSGGATTSDRKKKFDTYTFSTQARYGLSRWLAVFAQYFLYHYKLAPEVAQRTGLPPGIDRQGVRVGLTTNFPLLR